MYSNLDSNNITYELFHIELPDEKAVDPAAIAYARDQLLLKICEFIKANLSGYTIFALKNEWEKTTNWGLARPLCGPRQ